MKSEVHDSRDGAARPRRPVLRPSRGEFDELRVFLIDALGIPKRARRFSITFAVGESPVVNVEYLPRETDDPPPPPDEEFLP